MAAAGTALNRIMSTPPFAVTFDYRCPFARNVHEHLVEAMRGGADWDVEFLPFSLTQSHVEEGGDAGMGRPDKASDLIAIEAGLVVRDKFPEQFPTSTSLCSPPGTTRDATCATKR